MSDISLRSGDNIILVIDTDSYAGNFERQLCGFVTGVWDEDRGHGQEEAEEAEEDFPSMIAAISAKVTTQHHREYGDVSNTIRVTPGRLNNGSGFCYNANDPAAREDAKARAKKFTEDYHAAQIAECERRLREEDFEPATKPGGWTKSACERTIESALASIERSGDHEWPAYESVAIFLSAPLTSDELAFVEMRARDYGERRALLKKTPIQIKAVYQVSARLVVEETRL